MAAFEIPLTLTEAIAIIFVFTEFFVRIVRMMRNTEYERSKRRDRELRAKEPPFPQSQAFEAAQKWVDPFHKRAVEQQNAYYDCLTRSVSALTLALIVLVLGAALLEAEQWFAVLSATVEALSFLYVLYQFRVGRNINRIWVSARIEAEIARQAGTVMATGRASAGLPDIDTTEEAKWEKLARTASQPARAKHPDLAEDLENVWTDHSSVLSSYVSAVTPDAFQTYLGQRARRQSRWFVVNIERLSRNHKQREFVLRLVFIACTLIAIAKFSLSVPFFTAPAEAKPIILVVLFMAAAWASAYTAFYISNNQRSLFHRYSTQARQIRQWLEESETIQSTAPFDAARAQRSILWFEALMHGELIDWVRITDHDSMELTP